MAGEVGHMYISANGVQCGCGSQGCLETESSATAIVRKAKEAIRGGASPALAAAASEGAEITAELAARTAEAGDAASQAIFESVGLYLGIGLSILVNTLNLPLYVIGGGVSEGWPLFAPAMLAELRKRSYIFAEGSTQLKRAELGGDAGLYGAACLALQHGSGAAPVRGTK
jgi:glucokinase